MPRRKRTHHFKAFYHTMFRGNHQQKIFFCDKDRFKFYQYLAEACELYDCKIHLFCLMTNHVHLVIEVGHIPLAKIMQSIISRYARFLNKKMHRKGYLCEGRYQSIMIQNEKYLLELCYYIHMNPIKSGSVTNLNEYYWSSHNTYNLREKIPWVTTEFILNLLEKAINAPAHHYLHFMQDREQLYKEPTFCKFAKNGELIICDAVTLNSKDLEHVCKINLPLDKITAIICEEMQISQEKLISSSLHRRAVLARSMVTYFAHYRAGYLLSTIANCLDRRADSISKTTHRTLKQIQTNYKLSQLIKTLENKLILQTHSN